LRYECWDLNVEISVLRPIVCSISKELESRSYYNSDTSYCDEFVQIAMFNDDNYW